jgi:hypothetical protein
MGGRKGQGSVEAEVGAVEEGGELGEAKGEAFGRGGAEGARAALRQKSGQWKKAGSSERRRARRSGEAGH